jgi:DNA-binding CsgD family transcriptional regulator
MSAHVPRVFSAGMHFWFLNLPYYTDDLAERRALQAIAADALPRIDRAFPSMVSGMPWFEIVAGNWREAKELLYAYLNRPVGWGWRLPFLSLACWLERHTGNPQLAWSRVHECLPAGPRTEPGDEQFMFITPLIRRAVELALDDGDSERARPWLEAHDRWLRWSGAVTGQAQSHLLWGRYWQQSGNAQDARQEAGLALDAALGPRQPLQLIAAYRFLGELDVSERLFDAAESRLAQALELADACALPYERARCLLALARLHAARNDSAALALIENVHTICKPLDAMPILAEADNLERELLRGIQRPAGLSAREMEVLRLIAEGLSDAQIATQLSISPRTVNRHTTSIYNKLGINSRVAATRFAIERQLL